MKTAIIKNAHLKFLKMGNRIVGIELSPWKERATEMKIIDSWLDGPGRHTKTSLQIFDSWENLEEYQRREDDGGIYFDFRGNTIKDCTIK